VVVDTPGSFNPGSGHEAHERRRPILADKEEPKPAHKIRAGASELAIWRNDGEVGLWWHNPPKCREPRQEVAPTPPTGIYEATAGSSSTSICSAGTHTTRPSSHPATGFPACLCTRQRFLDGLLHGGFHGLHFRQEFGILTFGLGLLHGPSHGCGRIPSHGALLRTTLTRRPYPAAMTRGLPMTLLSITSLLDTTRFYPSAQTHFRLRIAGVIRRGQFQARFWFRSRFSQAVQEAPHRDHERRKPYLDVGRRPDA
jgi:hypothetical protein